MHYAGTIQVNLLVTDMDPIIQDTILTTFAARVRRGYYGRCHQIKVQGVTDALAAISKTIELAGYKSPVYRSPNTYNLAIECCIEGL
jgi:hypothetical protein